MTTQEFPKKSLAHLVLELEILERVLDEKDEITDEDVKQWSFVNDVLETKTDKWIAYLDQAEALLRTAEERKKRAEKDRKRKERLLNSLHGYLRHVLLNRPDHKLEGEDGSLVLRRNPPKLETKFSLERFSTEKVLPNFVAEEFPERFLKVVQVKTLDTEKVRAALKMGEAVPHCEMTQEFRVEVK